MARGCSLMLRYLQHVCLLGSCLEDLCRDGMLWGLNQQLARAFIRV
jgi:hypothetical protein